MIYSRSTIFIFLFFLIGSELFASDDSFVSVGFILTIIIAIAGIAISIYLFTKVKKIKQDYEKIQQTSKENEDKQTQMVASMSEQIFSMVKQAVGNTSTIASKINKDDMSEEISTVIENEYKLLDMANDLIEFLRLKSKRVTISVNNYKLDNLLNDLTGFLSKNLDSKNLELTYAVDKNIPQELIGDTLKISKILYNIMDYTVEQGATKLVLNISKTRGFERDYELTFFIKTNLRRDIERDTTLFNANYNEADDSYDSLGLFVAKELASLMDGELIARNDIKGDIEFLFSMAFNHPEVATKEDIDTRLLRRNIAIVDTNRDYSNSLKSMFETYEHNVMVIKPNEFLTSIRESKGFDIIAMDERLFSAETLKQLEKTSTYKQAKIVALSNYLRKSDPIYYTKDADFKLYKPTTRESLFMLLEKIYLPQDAQTNISNKNTSKLKTHIESFEKTPNVTSETFALFKGSKILIVEDDAINQKVVAGVLKHSLMHIDIANNGEECLEYLKRDNNYDLILMDINMPKMDGYTATKIIRQDSDYDSIAIISLTALTSPDEIDKMFEVGMNAHLAKPLHKAQLFTALDMFLEQTDEMEEKNLKPKVLTFEGLDREKGIAKANGNEDFYKEILREFYETYKNSSQIFEKLINDYRYEQVRMLCLDIKGLSGSIGANELHDLMVDIHQKLIFKKFDLLHEYIKPFQDTLDILNNTLKNYIDS